MKLCLNSSPQARAAPQGEDLPQITGADHAEWFRDPFVLGNSLPEHASGSKCAVPCPCSSRSRQRWIKHCVGDAGILGSIEHGKDVIGRR